ncbi:MAG: acetyl-CoA carboxylase biotin carboxyl carrier protein [Nannocystaceae bacterium]
MNEPADPKFPDLRYVRELAKIFKESELHELELESGEARILMRHADAAVPAAMPMSVAMPAMAPAPVAAPAPAPAAAAAPVAAAAAATGDYITSPFVGTFYRTPRPDAPAFVDVGKSVAAGATVCIIEAMKLFNEIEADYACRIEEILVENGAPVEYGTKLFRVQKL